MSVIQRPIEMDAMTPTKPCQKLFWFAGVCCAAVTVAMLTVMADVTSKPERAGQVYSGVRVTVVRSLLAGRTDCSEIGASDLQSPAEGLWFQSNCTPNADAQLSQVSTNCNRSSLDDSFSTIGPGLYVSRLNSGSLGYLWFSHTEGCFDLVSAKVVTFVCTDQTVSFKWNTNACSAHGGILAAVNGR